MGFKFFIIIFVLFQFLFSCKEAGVKVEKSSVCLTSNCLNTNSTKKNVGADIYLGGNGNIHHFQLNFSNDQVTDLGAYSLPAGGNVAWMEWDKTQQKVFAANSGQPRLEVFSYNESTGNLSFDKGLLFGDRNTHLAIHKSNSKYNFFAASYGDSEVNFYSAPLDLSSNSFHQTIPFPNRSNTHSNSFDPSRNLLFVANLALNSINIYKLEGTTLSSVGDITVVSPRIVLYDKNFDKLYLSTESRDSNPSYIKIYDIVQTGNQYSLSESGSFTMGTNGSDLKINHSRGFVSSLVREATSESLEIVPLNNLGLLDQSRSPHKILIDEVRPRSLQITNDGTYYMVTPHSNGALKDLMIYKINYDSNQNIIDSNIIYEVVLPGSFQSNFLINRFD